MHDKLKNTLLISGLAVALGAASTASAATARLDNAVSYAGEAGQFEQAQFFWGGRNYCWYAGGWQGPGYYWCGYAWRRGYGWGGPIGWHGWGRPGWRGDRDHWRGDHRDWHDDHGGWHGDRGDDHGGWRGGDDHGGWRGGDDRGGDRGAGDHGDHHDH